MGVDDDHRYRQPDDGWDDDGWDHDGWDHDEAIGPAPDFWDGTADDDMWADTELDGRVRQQLSTLVPLHHEAFDQWDGLRPRMARARRRRHAAQAMATSVLVAAVALASLQGASRYLPDDGALVSADNGGFDSSTSATPGPQLATGEASSTSTGEGASSRGAASSSPIPTGDAGGDGADDEAASSVGPAADAVVAEDTSLPPGSGATAVTTVPMPGGAAPPATTPPAGTASTIASSPTYRTTTSTSRSTTTATTRAASTTTRATTTTTAPTTVVQVRELATLDVTINGSQIRLVTVHPASGVRAEVHNSGPEKLEITLTRSGESHEAVITVRNGNVVTSVVDADDD